MEKTQIDAVILAVSELPDRDSPEDQPEMMLVSADELREILEDVAAEPAGWRDFLVRLVDMEGGMVNGNRLSRAAKELLDSAPVAAAASGAVQETGIDLKARLRSGASCDETWHQLAARTNQERAEAADRIAELEAQLTAAAPGAAPNNAEVAPNSAQRCSKHDGYCKSAVACHVYGCVSQILR